MPNVPLEDKSKIQEDTDKDQRHLRDAEVATLGEALSLVYPLRLT